MLSDLHIRKFIEGRLSREETLALIKEIKQNPALRERYDRLREDNTIVRRSWWRRLLVEKKKADSSNLRYAFFLPAFFGLTLCLVLGLHWLGGSGSSTFTLLSANHQGLELLYQAKDGWRFFNQDFVPSDSLGFSVRDEGMYHTALYLLWKDSNNVHSRLAWYSQSSPLSQKKESPRFALSPGIQQIIQKEASPCFLIFYGKEPIDSLSENTLAEAFEQGRLSKWTPGDTARFYQLLVL